MRNTLKFLFLAALIFFVGIPVAFALFVLAMSVFGVVLGVGLSIVGLLIAGLKIALMVILPIALVVWIAKRVLAPNRTYY